VLRAIISQRSNETSASPVTLGEILKIINNIKPMKKSFETEGQEGGKMEETMRRQEVPYAKGWTFGDLYDKLVQDGVLEESVSLTQFYRAIRKDQDLSGDPNQEELFNQE